MDHKDPLLQRLAEMLRWKKSKAFYAEQLGISPAQVDELLNLLRNSPPPDDIPPIDSGNFRNLMEDFTKNTAVITQDTTEEIKSLEDLIRVCNIDTTRWNIDRYVQNFWGTLASPKWQVKAYLSTKEDEQLFQDSFINFLETYAPVQAYIKPVQSDNPNSCLIINKQDQHHNKLDIGGDNDIDTRFSKVEQAVKQTLLQVSVSNNIDKVIYIIGSDEFNSEWSSMTTKGTPQLNLLPHHEAFERICHHEVSIINELLMFSKEVEILYIPGNHDEYVGWHLVQWLKCYYRQQHNLSFDITPSYTKAVLYSNTIMVFNHGDEQKLEKLAQSLPFKYKALWAQADHYYIFTGDKHHLLAKDIASVECYQIPSLSKAKSSWDSKKGHDVTKAQMFSFVIEQGNGMGNIIKKLI